MVLQWLVRQGQSKDRQSALRSKSAKLRRHPGDGNGYIGAVIGGKADHPAAQGETGESFLDPLDTQQAATKLRRCVCVYAAELHNSAYSVPL